MAQNSIERNGVQNGQIWLSACGAFGGYVITDVEKYAEQDEVLLVQFTRGGGVEPKEYTRTAFKLSYRAFLPAELPQWVPQSVIDYANGLKAGQ